MFAEFPSVTGVPEGPALTFGLQCLATAVPELLTLHFLHVSFKLLLQLLDGSCLDVFQLLKNPITAALLNSLELSVQVST